MRLYPSGHPALLSSNCFVIMYLWLWRGWDLGEQTVSLSAMFKFKCTFKFIDLLLNATEKHFRISGNNFCCRLCDNAFFALFSPYSIQTLH